MNNSVLYAFNVKGCKDRSGVKDTGIIKDFMSFRKIKYSPIFAIGGEYQANGSMEESDIVGAIANCIATNTAKLQPQVIRNDKNGLTIKDDYLSRLLSVRWSPELTPYDALYKIASDLVYKSNSISVIFYNDDFTKIKSIIPITTTSLRIFEDNDIIFCQFTWAYDKKTYTVPYDSVIHIKARYSKKRFLGSAPDDQLRNSLELLDVTGQGLRNMVKNSANLKGYLKYNNFADDEELKEKVREFQTAYMDASNDGGLAALDNSVDFKEISQRTPLIPTVQSQFLRDNVFRYYNLNDKILMSMFNEQEWNAFYESVIEPIAIQLSLEFTFKVLTERERGFGNKIIFSANRLQYATLQTRVAIAKEMFDRGTLTINEFRELLYYEPIEGGDVRMVSLNFVKANEQSIYQIGEEANPEEDTGQQAKAIHILRMAVPAAIKKGGE